MPSVMTGSLTKVLNTLTFVVVVVVVVVVVFSTYLLFSLSLAGISILAFP